MINHDGSILDDWHEADEEGNTVTSDMPDGELGEFAELVLAVEDFRKRETERYNLREDEAYLLESDVLDLQELKDEARTVVQARKKLDEQLQTLDPLRATTWLLERDQSERELRLRHKLALASVGLTQEMIFDVADDCQHLAEDAVDSASRELRKELRHHMRSLDYRERQQLLRDMLENGQIDEAQFRFLWSEFG